MQHLQLRRPIAFFDLETTGVDPVKDRIVEIAVIKVAADGSRTQYVKRINPEMPIPEGSSLIHGIYDADVVDAPTFKEVGQELLQFFENCDIGGYNSNRFDLPVLTEEFYRAGIDVDFKTRKLIDVQQIFFKKEARTLSAAYEFYCNKDLKNAHSAEADVIATIEVLDAQLARYQDLEKNVAALHEFSGAEELVDYAKRLVRKDGAIYFNFGKHKGKLASAVFNSEPQYYDWMMNADFSRDTKKALSDIYSEMKLGKFKR